jgi:hypothetical protein
MLRTTLTPQRVNVVDPVADRANINRLLAAAVINTGFRSQLLNNPRMALQAGFAEEQFSLSTQAEELLASIHAPSLKEFARQLCEKLPVIPLAI